MAGTPIRIFAVPATGSTVRPFCVRACSTFGSPGGPGSGSSVRLNAYSRDQVARTSAFAEAERFESTILGRVEQRIQVRGRTAAGEARCHRVEDRDKNQRQHRAGEQAADDDDRERPADERSPDASASAQHRQRHQREHGGEGGHEDRTQPVPAALDDRIVQVEAAVAVLLDEVQQNDGIGDHDAGEHQDSDQSRQVTARCW